MGPSFIKTSLSTDAKKHPPEEITVESEGDDATVPEILISSSVSTIGITVNHSNITLNWTVADDTSPEGKLPDTVNFTTDPKGISTAS